MNKLCGQKQWHPTLTSKSLDTPPTMSTEADPTPPTPTTTPVSAGGEKAMEAEPAAEPPKKMSKNAMKKAAKNKASLCVFMQYIDVYVYMLFVTCYVVDALCILLILETMLFNQCISTAMKSNNFLYFRTKQRKKNQSGMKLGVERMRTKRRW